MDIFGRRTVRGVYSAEQFTSWPLLRPWALLELLPQVLEFYRAKISASSDAEVQRVVRDLARDGAAIMHDVAPPALLDAGRRDLDTLVERMPQLQGSTRVKRASTGGKRTYAVHEHQLDLHIYRSHDPLMFSPTYAQFLLLPALRQVAEGYLGASWLYQAMIATRTQASAPTNAGFAQWHHDARGRKLNVLLLLTDVPADGSATIVLKGSQRLLYSRKRRKQNFFADAEIAQLKQAYQWEVMVCGAPAGSLVFFDSQALHLGRRSPHARDAFQVNCMTHREHLWRHDIPRELLSSLSVADQQTLLQRADLTVKNRP
jgi:ectoine hydroxylase-related dioxygenase (phytanoyl-CoA dioxygenase family)